MHESTDGKKVNQARRPRLPPGRAASERAIDRLTRFQDLVRHHDGFGSDVHLARPLSDLIGPYVDPAQQRSLLRAKIQQATPAAWQDLHVFMEPRKVSWQEPAYSNGAKTMKTYTRDLVLHYLDLPNRYENHDILMGTIEMSIGAYRHWGDVAERRRFNPLFWLAWLLNLPMHVLEMAGFGDDGAHGRLLDAYIWLLRALMLLLLLFVAAKLGVTVQWTQLFGILK